MEYETIRRLGRGGMGVVDLARGPDGREVALKRLSLHGTPEELEKARQRIRREAEVLRRLDHPAIVALLDVFDDGDDLVLVMDYLPGGNLAQRVNADGPLPVAEIGEIGDRLLDALTSAHRQGVVHRDIKPANVLFDADGNVALGDFGAAVHRDATPGLTASEVVVGTPGFMSPEQARGEPATTASDMFSLGATLAFAATGQGPFGTADPRVLMLRAAAGRTERLPRSLPAELRRRLDAMCERDPKRRPTAAAARGGPEGTQAWTAAQVVARRRPQKVVGSAVVAVLAVGAAVAVLAGGDGNGGPIATSSTAAATTTTEEPCEDLPYQRCGREAAPNTDGTTCLAGYYDYDQRAGNGCEATPDERSGSSPLRDELRANVVPADDTDSYPMDVSDGFQVRCDGRLSVTLTAPEGAIQRLTVLDADDEELGTTLSSDGQPGTVELREPNCFNDDSTTLRVRVEAAPGSTPAAGDYVLTKRGSY